MEKSCAWCTKEGHLQAVCRRKKRNLPKPKVQPKADTEAEADGKDTSGSKPQETADPLEEVSSAWWCNSCCNPNSPKKNACEKCGDKKPKDTQPKISNIKNPILKSMSEGVNGEDKDKLEKEKVEIEAALKCLKDSKDLAQSMKDRIKEIDLKLSEAPGSAKTECQWMNERKRLTNLRDDKVKSLNTKIKETGDAIGSLENQKREQVEAKKKEYEAFIKRAEEEFARIKEAKQKELEETEKALKECEEMYATDMETVEDNIRQSLNTNGGKQTEQQQQLGPLDVASMPRVLTADQITEHDVALGLQKDVPELQALNAELAQRLLKSFMNQLNNASMKPSVAQNIAHSS